MASAAKRKKWTILSIPKPTCSAAVTGEKKEIAEMTKRSQNLIFICFLGLEVLGNAVNRRNYGNGDETDYDSHEDHQHRLDERSQIFRRLVDLVLINVGQIKQCLA